MANNERVAKLVEDMVASVVDDEDRVTVNTVASGTTCVIEVDVAPADRGKVIGKGGSTANAIRTIIRAVSGKTHVRYFLEINEG